MKGIFAAITILLLRSGYRMGRLMHLRGLPALAVILLGSMLAAYAQQSPATSLEGQGHADRMSFEAWMGSLSGDRRRGADFWGQERSKAKAVSCLAADGSLLPEFVSGCQEAQRRLALPDVRRRTEPDYRKGWNADVMSTDAARPVLPSAVAPNGGSRPVQRPPEIWYVGSLQDRTCFLTTDVFEGAKNPEEVVSTFEQARIFYVIRRSDNGMVTLHNSRDPNNVIPLFKDKAFCEYAVKVVR